MLQETWLGCRNAVQRKDTCVFVFLSLPLSLGEQSDLEMHKQRCPLWHRRRPHSSEKDTQRTLDADRSEDELV